MNLLFVQVSGIYCNFMTQNFKSSNVTTEIPQYFFLFLSSFYNSKPVDTGLAVEVTFWPVLVLLGRQDYC